MNFTTINELVGQTKGKINDLHSILDVLITQYKAACEIIDSKVDYRQKHVEQIKELYDSLSEIVDLHPAMHVDKLEKETLSKLAAVYQSIT
jgi:hypothetical protein